MRFISTSLLFISLTTASLAQLSSLSTNCQAAATSLIGNSALSTCIDLLALVNVLSATGSIVTPFNTWLQGACTSTCSSATLANASATIEAGCASDISSSNSLAIGLEELTTNYTQVKGVLCLAATSNNTYCLTNLLNSVQATGTNVTVSSITSLLTGTGTAITSLFSSLPSTSVCTDCNKALLSSLSKLTGTTSSSISTLESDLSSECGASFIDGTVPSDVAVASASGGSSTSTSSSASATASNKGGAGVKSMDAGVKGWKAVVVVGAFVVGGAALVV